MDIFEQYPQLRTARQPPSLPIPRCGSFSYTPAAVFADLVRQVETGTFWLRSPTESTRGLVPFRGMGSCLSPILNNEIIWIDPSLEPADGDFVVVLLDPDELARIIERHRDDAEWLATYGPNPGPIVTKLLKASGSDWFLQDRTSAFRLNGWRGEPRSNRVLGVVRKVSRDGDDIYGSQLAHAVELNAITQTVSNSIAFPPNIDANGSNSPLTTTVISVSIVSTGGLLIVNWNLGYDASGSAGGTTTSVKFVTYIDGAPLSSGEGVFLDSTPSAVWKLASISITDQPAAGSHTYSLVITASGTGSGSGVPINSGVVELQSAFLNVSELKR